MHASRDVCTAQDLQLASETDCQLIAISDSLFTIHILLIHQYLAFSEYWLTAAGCNAGGTTGLVGLHVSV